MGRTKTLRVGEKEHALILRAKQELMRKGYDALPEDLRPDADERLTLGVVIGVGSRLLIRWLESTPPAERQASRSA